MAEAPRDQNFVPTALFESSSTPGTTISGKINQSTGRVLVDAAAGTPTAITVANEATDTSCFVAFFTAATGDLGPKTNANLTFNSATGVLTSTAATITTLSITSFGSNWTNVGRTVADLGTITTADINGGTLDGAVIGGSSAAAITGTTINGTIITGNSFVPNSNTVPSNGMYLPAANTLGWAINSAAELQLTGTALSPAADGGSSLGTTALGWQNLFANTGFVLNIENSDWVATHTAGILTVGTGDLRITTAGTNSASAVTVGGTQTLTSKTLTASSNVLGGVTMTLGSDADGDIYYRASNVLTRLAKGTTLQQLRMNAGATAPEWATITGGTTATTLFPMSVNPYDGTTGSGSQAQNVSTNTTMRIGLIYVESTITVGNIRIRSGSNTTPGTVDIALFSADGATRLWKVTSASISATGNIDITGPGSSVPAGYYYIAVLPISTTNLQLNFSKDADEPWTMSNNSVPSGKVKWSGTLTVTASTIPTTITPTSITAAQNSTLQMRWDT